MATDEVHFSHVLFLPAARSPREQAWQPRADVYRVPEGWLIKFELAGVRPEDVRLTMRSDTLVMQGTRRDARLSEGQDCYRMEIAYSRFERILELPGVTEAAEIVASYREGMLLVRIKSEGPP
jgi:HSP20 family protein